MVFVVKHDGRRDLYDPEKIRNSCLRAGASSELSENVVNYVSQRVYNGMPTKKLMTLVYERLGREEMHVAKKYSLKEAIAKLAPEGYEFEWYVCGLLKALGYDAKHSPEPKIQGKCVDHEVDVLAEKGGKKSIIECKHHFQSHTYTGLEVPMVQWARFEDINENGNSITDAWVVTNTKFSEHAIKYAAGKGIKLVGWNYPYGKGLERVIEQARAYPLTFLKLSSPLRWNLVNCGVTNTIEFFKASDIVLQKAGIQKQKAKELKGFCAKLTNGEKI